MDLVNDGTQTTARNVAQDIVDNWDEWSGEADAESRRLKNPNVWREIMISRVVSAMRCGVAPEIAVGGDEMTTDTITCPTPIHVAMVSALRHGVDTLMTFPPGAVHGMQFDGVAITMRYPNWYGPGALYPDLRVECQTWRDVWMLSIELPRNFKVDPMSIRLDNTHPVLM